jgi:hypothetical protein
MVTKLCSFPPLTHPAGESLLGIVALVSYTQARWAVFYAAGGVFSLIVNMCFYQVWNVLFAADNHELPKVSMTSTHGCRLTCIGCLDPELECGR